MVSTVPFSSLMQSYFLYSAILALKQLVLAPMAAVVYHPEKVQRAYISDLKNLTPFWLVSALYMTTGPDQATAVYLLRIYVITRFVIALGYLQKLPSIVTEAAFCVSFMITCFMGGWVVYTYRKAL
ncbi:unnamed protein product [Arctia plantaginis]|uniref:Microsomal glutathione S-transferase 1 n=1 Tax=Arctia plantaginis TaxID=874455 RepID=A0A8S1BDE0_ARCPL|nr:unnamed protein product [Arctia plantaginis]CAB3254915.1 unnamed protein product [Arctia plantaginis]